MKATAHIAACGVRCEPAECCAFPANRLSMSPLNVSSSLMAGSSAITRIFEMSPVAEVVCMKRKVRAAACSSSCCSTASIGLRKSGNIIRLFQCASRLIPGMAISIMSTDIAVCISVGRVVKCSHCAGVRLHIYAIINGGSMKSDSVCSVCSSLSAVVDCLSGRQFQHKSAIIVSIKALPNHCATFSSGGEAWYRPFSLVIVYQVPACHFCRL